MLPCQQTCPDYRAGCHKTCSRWKSFQAQQKIQRQKKRDYLKYYDEVCATMIRQFSALSARRAMG